MLGPAVVEEATATFHDGAAGALLIPILLNSRKMVTKLRKELNMIFVILGIGYQEVRGLEPSHFSVPVRVGNGLTACARLPPCAAGLRGVPARMCARALLRRPGDHLRLSVLHAPTGC